MDLLFFLYHKKLICYFFRVIWLFQTCFSLNQYGLQLRKRCSLRGWLVKRLWSRLNEFLIVKMTTSISDFYPEVSPTWRMKQFLFLWNVAWCAFSIPTRYNSWCHGIHNSEVTNQIIATYVLLKWLILVCVHVGNNLYVLLIFVLRSYKTPMVVSFWLLFWTQWNSILTTAQQLQ